MGFHNRFIVTFILIVCTPSLLVSVFTPAGLATTLPFSGPITILQNSDDGTEAGGVWYESGIDASMDYLGSYNNEKHRIGFRFNTENLNPGGRVVHARLRFPSMGGEIESSLILAIEGVLQESPSTFSQEEQPSQKLPKTKHKVRWEIKEPWDVGDEKMPLYYSSPDLSPLINEILSLGNWGQGVEGKQIILTIEPKSHGTNYVKFIDYDKKFVGNSRVPVVLELYESVYDTFLGKELLGRVTDRSALVNLYALIDTEIYIEYGTSPDRYTHRTETTFTKAEKPIEIILDGLRPDVRHYYRVVYKKAGIGRFEFGKRRSFHTQRAKGSSYAFSIQADSHIQLAHQLPIFPQISDLYSLCHQNMATTKPDFLISMGDFTLLQTHSSDSRNFQESVERYLLQRSYLDKIGHSIPFYLTIGNHEGEQGWLHDFTGTLDSNKDSFAVTSIKARKEIIPNPYPDRFYSGNIEFTRDYGLREDYFAWEWGDALYVVLSPYWYTRQKPADYKDGWLWTIGDTQYDWLYETLHHSEAKWKFVFIHHLTSTASSNWKAPYYGRGGIEVAKYKVAGYPSYEWGGEDENGNNILSQKRPKWKHGAIHDLLVEAQVTIVFHGHDHVFGKQDLDGIVYQECPVPIFIEPNYGFKDGGLYQHGTFFPNSGHLHVEVSPEYVMVHYIRAFLPEVGENGEISFSYEIR